MRLRIIRHLLSREECIVGELVELVDLAPSTVSEHLRVLKAAGLIKGEVDGPRRCYCVDRSVLALVQALLVSLEPAV